MATSATRRIETQRRHAIELHSKTLAAVQDLEVRLDISARWTAGDEQWVAAANMLGSRRYQRALDALEGLVVARMFELSKVNMADTGKSEVLKRGSDADHGAGYKLRKHIAKALQARSQGVKSALATYNDAAAAMTPPRDHLTWDQIVDYAFLADFDLLREGREDIRSEPWAQPAGRVALDQHFKLLRADEEITRLNLEIPRLVTHMADEERFLVYHQRRLAGEGHAAMAHQVHRYRMERGRFDDLHRERLLKLSKEPGFTGSLLPGVSLSRERCVPDVPPATNDDVDMEYAPVLLPSRSIPAPPEEEEADVDDAAADLEAEAVADAFEHIMRITHDAPRPPAT
jgi:hypothetical protein